jgi:DedD protein
MSGRPATAVCPLCRQPIPEVKGDPAASRLCDKCREMVDSIRPSNPTPPPVGAQPLGAQPDPSVTRTERRPPPLPPATQPRSAPAGPDYANDQSAVGQTFPVAAVPVTHSEGGGPGTEPVSAGPEYMLVPNEGTNELHEHNDGFDSDSESENWPLMVDSPEEPARGSGMKRWAILIAVILVGGALAFYFGFKRGLLWPGRQSASNQSSQGKSSGPAAPVTSQQPQANTLVTQNQSQNQSKPGAVESGSPAALQAAPQAAALQPSPAASATTPLKDAKAATETKDTQQAKPAADQHTDAGSGSLSFQMASFPSQSGADQFCEKLRNIGIPAYVVAADIPHRGKWFRVRAGRFASPVEAQQTSAGWQQRASKSGISLQLVPCDYQKP